MNSHSDGTHRSPGELVPSDEALDADGPTQAEVIMEESEERTLDPEGTRRRSTQTPGN